MGETLGIIPRTYYGLDADKADQVGLNCERYYATDTGIVYKWDGVNSQWRGGYEFVSRLVNAVDFNIGNFTTDGNWKVDGLDVSGIVPLGAIAVLLDVEINDDAANSSFLIRTSAAANYNRFYNVVQVANQTFFNTGLIAIDSNRKLDYFGSNLVFITINVTVCGWFI